MLTYILSVVIVLSFLPCVLSALLFDQFRWP